MKNVFKRTLLAFCVAIALAIAPLVHAQIVVKDNIVHFKNNQKLITSFPIANKSSKNFAIKAEAYELVYSASGKEEKLVPTKDVLVIPTTINLPAKRGQMIRLIAQKRPTDKEKAYRIKFSPVEKNFAQEFQTEETIQNVNVITVAGILTIVEPTTPKVDYSATWDNNTLTIENTGNVNLIFRQAYECVEGVACKIEGIRLWPGKKWELKVPQALQGKPIQLEMRARDELKLVEVRP